jgi:hypothetical protein
MKSLRWNPFAMWSDHCALVERLAKLEDQVERLEKAALDHATITSHELFKLKNPWYGSTVEKPLTPEQEDIVKIFMENRKLPEEIRRGFASGGYFNRKAEGRFGEVPSEQVRATDAQYDGTPYAVCNTPDGELPDVSFEDLRKAISEISAPRPYPGHSFRHPQLELPRRANLSGIRDPQPPRRPQ